MIKRAPLSAMQNQELARQSEHEKPYRDNNYPEMQHYWPGVPGITDPNWDFPWMGDPIPDITNVPWEIEFYCPETYCYIIGKTVKFTPKCTWPVRAAWIEFNPDISARAIIDPEDFKTKIEITANLDAVGTARLVIEMVTVENGMGLPMGIQGTHNKSIESCGGGGECVCVGPSALPGRWDVECRDNEGTVRFTAAIEEDCMSSPHPILDAWCATWCSEWI